MKTASRKSMVIDSRCPIRRLNRLLALAFAVLLCGCGPTMETADLESNVTSEGLNPPPSNNAPPPPAPLPPNPTGKDYYVNTSGSDSNSGTEGSPFRTITYAYSKVVAGDRILVQPGRYTDFTSGFGLRLNKNGTAIAPITLRSVKRGEAIIDGQQISGKPTVVYIEGDYNIFEGFRVTNHTELGIGIWGGIGNIIRFNEVDHVGMGSQPTRHTGIYTDNTSRLNLYDGNFVHDNGNFATSLKGHGFYITGHNETYVNNIVSRNAGYGFQIYAYDVLSNVNILNNVSAFNGGSGMVLFTETAGEAFDNIQVKNNIFYNNYRDRYGANGSIFILNGGSPSPGGGIVFDNNLSFGAGADIVTSGSPIPSYSATRWIRLDPKFVLDLIDFRLQPGSPALGTGLNLIDVKSNFDGATRSTPYNLGAY